MLETILQLGDAVEHRGVVIAPLFPRRTPVAEYATLEDALPLGLRIDEVSDAGSVPELAVTNPTDANVLLYDGEELLGAKQNRILNVTVLVGAQSTTRDPGLLRRGRPLEPPLRELRVRAARGAPRSCGAARRSVLAAEPLARGARPERGLGRGAGASPHAWASTRRPARRPTSSARARTSCASSSGRSRSSPASAARCSRSATTSASTTSRGRRRSRASIRSCAPATCSTGSSGSTASPQRRRRLAGFVDVGRLGDAGAAALGRARRGRAAARRAASSARGSSSTASCSSSAPSRATSAAGGSRGRAGAAEFDEYVPIGQLDMRSCAVIVCLWSSAHPSTSSWISSPRRARFSAPTEPPTRSIGRLRTSSVKTSCAASPNEVRGSDARGTLARLGRREPGSTRRHERVDEGEKGIRTVTSRFAASAHAALATCYDGAAGAALDWSGRS